MTIVTGLPGICLIEAVNLKQKKIIVLEITLTWKILYEIIENKFT